ncbi:MAG: cation diffusion facilitator family transporter [Planctomycetes bacterium]|nr:cation diffusion facilitator family transporter [Planctomycetota bacterium]
MSTAHLERRAARIALATSVVLLLTKLAAWRLTGSAAVFGDAMESVVNVAASALVIWSVWMANRPADESHPYGHGKAEFLSSAMEGGMISVAMLVVAVRSALELFDQTAHVHEIDSGLLLLAFTIMANGGVGLWLIQVARKTQSSALHADGVHLISDAWTSGAAVASLLLVRWTGLAFLDPIIALVMSVWVGFVGYRLIRRALGDLLDEQDLADLAKVEEILKSHARADGPLPRIVSYHKVRTRHSGRDHWVDFHLQLNGEMDLRRAHDVATEIENKIEAALGGTATAHVEPAS